MRVLGIDPGYAIVGWGVVDYAGNRFAPVDFGAVCTDAGVPFERRLDEVYTGIKEVIERTKPEVLAIEKLFYQHNQTTVIGVAEARGVILLAAAQAGLPIYEYTPMQVKQAVTGYGKAVKKQVQEMTRVLLHLPAVPKPDDTADALAMAITFCHTNGNQLNRYTRRASGRFNCYDSCIREGFPLYNLSVSLRSTAPLVGEPLAKRKSYPLCQGLPY